MALYEVTEIQTRGAVSIQPKNKCASHTGTEPFQKTTVTQENGTRKGGLGGTGTKRGNYVPSSEVHCDNQAGKKRLRKHELCDLREQFAMKIK